MAYHPSLLKDHFGPTGTPLSSRNVTGEITPPLIYHHPWLTNDEDSDIESDSEDQCPVILLFKDDKRRIQAPWQSALIIKAFGKSVGFKYMDFKIRSLWATQR